MSSTSFFETTLQDLGYAVRTLRKSPGFTVIAALSLALGIGANTAIFSLISALILRPLPVENPKALVVIGDGSRIGSISSGSLRPEIYSVPMYRELKAQNRSFSGILASGTSGRVLLGLGSGHTEPEDPNAPGASVRGRLVSGNYFSVLGVPAFEGRTFSEADDQAPGASPFVVVSHDFWQRRLESDPHALGRKITLNGSPFSIVGIARPGFTGEIVGNATEVWIPLSMQEQINPGRSFGTHWEISWLLLMGRTRPGVSLSAARAEVQGLFHRMIAAQPPNLVAAEERDELGRAEVPVNPGANGLSRLRNQFGHSLFTLLAIVSLVLLVASANVANLLLERATGRKKEIGVRLALGAGRGRLVRQLLTESLVLALLGGALGLVSAFWADTALVRLVAGPSSALDLRPDLSVLAFTAFLSLVTAIVFGLAPALTATRVELAPTLKESSRSLAGGSGNRWPLGKILVIAQFALSLLLLVGAGLFVRTLQNLERLDLGYKREGLLMASLDPIGGGVSLERFEPFATDLFERLKAVPGVAAVTASENGLFSGTESSTGVRIEGYSTGADGDPEVDTDQVAPAYFEVVGIPIQSGRDISAADRKGGAAVAVVNRALVETYFKGANPLGRHISTYDQEGKTTAIYEIVGVAANSRDHELRGTVSPRYFTAMLQGERPPSRLNLEIRAAQPDVTKLAVRKALLAAYPQVPLEDLASLSSSLGDQVQDERLIAKLSAIFGLLGLVLAAIGLYGVVSYAIARRTHELGLRMALGAQRTKVLWMVLRETLLLALAGTALGIPAALAATRAVESRLFGLSPTDPATLAVAVGVLLAVALVAGSVPGARATRVNPVQALRYE
ncbi:MAG: ABC transporter permease [Acidobacteriota bacterium]